VAGVVATVAGVAASWAIGVAGPLAAIDERGAVVVSPDAAGPGRQAILGWVLIWLVVAAVAWWARWPLQVPVQALATATVLAATASNVGRAQGLVAVTGGFVAFAALVGWRPWPSWPARPTRVAALALIPLVAAELTWVALDRLALTLALLGGSVVLIEAYHRGWGPVVWGERLIHERLPRQGAAAARTGSAAAVALARRVGSGGVRGSRVVAAAVVAGGRSALAWARDRTVGAWLGGLAVAAAFAPVFSQLTDQSGELHTYAGINDLGPHLDAARAVSFWPFDPGVPHFGFHVLAAIAAVPLGDRSGATLVLALSFGATFAAACLLARGPGRDRDATPQRWCLAIAGAFVLLGSPAMVLLWLGWLPPSTLVLTIHALFSPTWVVALPLSIGALVVLERILALDPTDPVPRPLLVAVAALVAVGTVAKPSFTLCLVPGLFAYLVARRDPWRRSAAVLGAVVLPVVPILAWQSWYLSTSPTEIGGGGVTFRPGSGPPYGWAALGWPYALPLAWPVVALAVSRGRFLADRTVQLVLSCSVFALAIFVLFTETGVRSGDGNLGVSAQVCLALLVLLSVRSVAGELRARLASGPRWWTDPTLVVAALVTVAFVAGGLLSAANTMEWVHVPIDWSQYQHAATAPPAR
jgi:hypothetical protein